MSAPITLPGASSRGGFEVWQIEASVGPDGPWAAVNGGAGGSVLRAAFEPEHTHWRVRWLAYTGATDVTPAAVIPGTSGGGARRTRGRVRLVA